MQIVVDSPPATNIPKRVTAIAAGLFIVLGVFTAITGDFSAPSPSSGGPESGGPGSTELATTELATLAGFKVKAHYKCIDKYKRCTDFWCDANCNHVPRNCPKSYCRKKAPAPAPPAADEAPPPQAPTTPEPTPAATPEPTPAATPEPTPAANDPPPRAPSSSCACKSGISGMIKGGGLACCPAQCATNGWSGAPNQCGGPGCDKGPDGKRDQYRYNNCCIGNPVTVEDGDVKAPYGVVATGRMCSTNGPPCINRAQKGNACEADKEPSVDPPPATPDPTPAADPTGGDPGAPGTRCVARTGSSPLEGMTGYKQFPKFFCCAASCGTCGGSGCSKRKGGSDGCCITKIRVSGVDCATSAPPCSIYDAKLASTDTARGDLDQSPTKNGGTVSTELRVGPSGYDSWAGRHWSAGRH